MQMADKDCFNSYDIDLEPRKLYLSPLASINKKMMTTNIHVL